MFPVFLVPLLNLLAENGTAITSEQLSSIVSALTAQITVSNIIGVLAAGITACIGICFAWWGARKLSGMLMKAFKRGKLRL